MPAADVEDVLQETFLAVWRGSGGYRAQGAAGGWLWGIARRQAALLLRRRGPWTATLTESEAACGGGLGDPAEVVQWRADVEAAVRSLGPAEGPERELFRLLYEEDRPVAEVARLLGVPAGTVKSRAHRLRRLLRAGLGDHSGRGGSHE
jgi:RNA polymerase sigma-70 factor (ECF subfamily)